MPRVQQENRCKPLQQGKDQEGQGAHRRDRNPEPPRFDYRKVRGSPTAIEYLIDVNTRYFERRHRSSATAATMITPVTTSCTQLFNSTLVQPLSTTVMINAPSKVPKIAPSRQRAKRHQ